jgi:hypothetical protein
MTRRRWIIASTKRRAGLGNRVRVVLGARALARATGRDFAYVWPVGRRFGARLDELWQIRARRIPASLSRLLALRYPYGDHTLACLHGRAREDRIWQIRTDHGLLLPEAAPSWAQGLRDLRPTGPIEDAVRGFHARRLAGSPYFGVMVRAHPRSHPETLAASPVAWFVARLRAIRLHYPEVGIFLSADTPLAAQNIQSELPGCVSLPDKGPYNSRAGLRAAVTDLYLLSASAHLIGPHYSSFTELAQKLAGDDLRLETSRTPASKALESGPWTQAVDPLRPWVRRAIVLG